MKSYTITITAKNEAAVFAALDEAKTRIEMEPQSFLGGNLPDGYGLAIQGEGEYELSEANKYKF
jgi:hypothetical protein